MKLVDRLLLPAMVTPGDGDAQGATVETSGGEAVTETDSQLSDTLTDQPPVEDYTRVSARFTLSEFELRLFQKELPLVGVTWFGGQCG